MKEFGVRKGVYKCLARHLALGVLQLAFFCCSQSLISPDEIPQGQAAVWTLFLAYLPGHLVGEREQLGAPASQPGVLGPLYLDQDANWQQPLPLPFAPVRDFKAEECHWGDVAAVCIKGLGGGRNQYRRSGSRGRCWLPTPKDSNGEKQKRQEKSGQSEIRHQSPVVRLCDCLCETLTHHTERLDCARQTEESSCPATKTQRNQK